MNEEAIERLENYEKMYEAVQLGLDDSTKRMEQLKRQGKARTNAYKQLLIQKQSYENIMGMYRLFGIK